MDALGAPPAEPDAGGALQNQSRSQHKDQKTPQAQANPVPRQRRATPLNSMTHPD